jgi:hypothetical protein
MFEEEQRRQQQRRGSPSVSGRRTMTGMKLVTVTVMKSVMELVK